MTADKASHPATSDAHWLRSARWPALVALLLAGHVTLLVGAATLAFTIPGAVVAPNGYERALEWDRIQADRRASEALGWTLTASVGPAGGPLGWERGCTLSLVDRDGAPVGGAGVTLRLFHHADAAAVLDRKAVLDDAGAWSEKLPLREEGLWRLELSATRGTQRYVREADLWVGASGGELTATYGDQR